MRLVLPLAALCALPVMSAHAAAPAFATIFGEHAVLQRDQPITLWGTADAGATVKVSLGAGSGSATADSKGKWRTTLPAMSAGGPYVLNVRAGQRGSAIKDIMVGDVYLCSGQSNMEFAVGAATGSFGDIASSSNPNIRFVNIAQDSQPGRVYDFSKAPQWQVAGPATIAKASAVCYYMARSLQGKYKIPVGLINASWGGTTIEGWIGATSLGSISDYRQGVDAIAQLARDPAGAYLAEEKRQEAWWDKMDPQAGAQRAFIAPGFNDAAWPSMTPAGRWGASDVAAFKDFKGAAWFRTAVDLTAAQAKSASHVLLGQVAAADTTWVNGVRVGAGATWWRGRDYAIPKGVLKAGKNVIAIRVLGDGGGGGLVSPASERYLRLADGNKLALPTTWKYQVGSPISAAPSAAPWEVPTSYTTLYNGMIAPLAGYKFKLAAWYQGESNAGAPQMYRTLLPLLFADWRQTFEQPELPFMVAQLASFGAVATKPGQSGWAELREAQSVSVRNDRHAGLAVTFDYGDRSDIHPTQKTIVGERMARAARAVAYGDSVTPGGPQASSVTRSGRDLLVRFTNTNGGLRTYSSDTAIGFEVCTGNECRYAVATVKDDVAALAGANTDGVTKVRYAWADAPYVNLYSADDLPAVPFEMNVK